MRDLWKLAGLVCVVTLLPACSGDSFVGSTSSTSTGGTAPGCSTASSCTVTAASVVATTDHPSIKSDGFDVATITATVLDVNRAAVEKAIVMFSVTNGKLSTGIGITDANGQATTKFSASPDNPSNGITFVTAEVIGVGSYAVPVTMTGTTLDISAKDGKKTIIVSTAPTKTLLVKATNAAGLGIYGASIAFSLAGDEDGTVPAPVGTTISPNPATTDITGTATVTLTGSASGSVYVTATGLGTSTTPPADFLVQDATAFRISAPTPAAGDEFVEMVSGGGVPQTVTVTAGLNNVAAGSTIWFTTTLGTWSNGLAYMSVPFAAVSATTGSVSETLTSAAGDNGFATVYAFVEADTKHNDTISIAMSPPLLDAAQIIVQSDEKTLFPSSSTTTYSTKVRVQVRTDSATGNYPIANAPIALTLENATGGGEKLGQGYGLTDVYGNFVTTFTSGITPTGQKGVRIVATVANAALSISSFSTIEIDGIPGSVALGTPRVIVETEKNNSINTYIMSALVAGGTGAAVSGAPVTLHVWPIEYRTGVWVKTIDAVGGEHFGTITTGRFINEDINENGILDLSEDINGNGILDPGEDVNGNGRLDLSEDTNLNGQLDPQASYAGTIPAIVTTGSDGAAPFNYVYLKDAADWVTVRAQGSTRVFGTEASTSTEFIPRSLKVEVDEGRVKDSPFRLWVFISVADVTGTAVVPGTGVAWNAPGIAAAATTTTPAYPAADKGGFSGLNFQLPASSGPYVVGDTVSVEVTSSIAPFPLSVRFIP